MIIHNCRLCLVYIESVVNHRGQPIFCDLENVCQASDEHVDQLFELIFKIWLLKRL